MEPSYCLYLPQCRRGRNRPIRGRRYRVRRLHSRLIIRRTHRAQLLTWRLSVNFSTLRINRELPQDLLHSSWMSH